MLYIHIYYILNILNIKTFTYIHTPHTHLYISITLIYYSQQFTFLCAFNFLKYFSLQIFRSRLYIINKLCVYKQINTCVNK